MNRIIGVLGVLICLGMAIPAAAGQKLTGPYLGQTPPGHVPQIFAPGIVGTGMHTRDFTMTPDGREIYFCVILGQYKLSNIVGCRLENGRWSAPQVVPGLDQPGVHYIEPHISPDGRKFFFASNRPVPGKEFSESDEDIWVMERQGAGWSEPRNLGAPVNTQASDEHSASLSADGKYLFFMSARMPAKETMPARLIYDYIAGLHRSAPNGNPTIYWVEASFIEKLRPRATGK